MAVVNNIDKRIQYKEGSNEMDKPRHEKLNGNIISIFPIKHEKPWYEDKPAESNGDETRKKTPGRRYASYEPEIDNIILAWEYWRDRWQSSPYKDRFKDEFEFMKWSTQNEDQPFNRGGIAGLIQ